MTTTQAQILYRKAGGGEDAYYSPDEWEDVRKEMETIVAAKSDISAGRIIEWWGCWDVKYTKTAFARKIRQAWKTLNNAS